MKRREKMGKKREEVTDLRVKVGEECAAAETKVKMVKIEQQPYASRNEVKDGG